jgi:hypothetical protein
MSEELAALRGPEEGVIKDMNAVTYEKQLLTASKEERDAMEWFAGKARAMHTAQGVVKLADSDIGSNPKLMGEQEIQNVADWTMHMVSKVLDYLSAGSVFDEIPMSQPIDENHSSPLHGKSHLEIVKALGNGNVSDGVMQVIDFVFNYYIASKYDPDFSEDSYREECEECEMEFDEQDFKDCLTQNRKAKWLMDHRSQFIRLGSARLFELEGFLMPVMKEPSSKQLNAAPTIEVPIDNGLNIIGTTWTLPEYTYTGKPKVVKREEFMIDDESFDSRYEPLSDKIFEKYNKNKIYKENVIGPWMYLLIDMEDRSKKRKIALKKMKSGELKPGDDLSFLDNIEEATDTLAEMDTTFLDTEYTTESESKN